MKPTKVYYYSDELNDEFSGFTRNTVTIDKNYQYIHNNIIWRAAAFLLYHVIMQPLAYIYMKIKYNMKIVNRKAVKQFKKQGCFFYGNHTQVPGDGFIPAVIAAPKKNYVMVNADNISLKGTRTFMEMVGALVVPNTMSAMKNFVKTVGIRINDNKNVVIYPEAHIWPYYTDIRPFKADSFDYPYMFKAPVFAFTVTYQKKKHSDKPRVTVYVDGPFEADYSLKHKDAAQKLRDEVYSCMKKRAQSSDYEYVKYVKKECKND